MNKSTKKASASIAKELIQLREERQKMRVALCECANQIEHLEELRLRDCGPIPSTTSADIVKTARSFSA